MAKALDKGFNAAVIHIANRLFPKGFDIAEDAPNDYDALMADYAARGRVTVWDGASESTIFADAEVNYAFRAWHDFHHIKGQHPFTLDGERAAYEAQCADLVALYGDGETTRRWIRLLEAEIIGQAAYKARYGLFPVNQVAFVLRWMRNPFDALQVVC